MEVAKDNDPVILNTTFQKPDEKLISFLILGTKIDGRDTWQFAFC